MYFFVLWKGRCTPMRSKITNLLKALRLTVVVSMVAALLTPLATVTPAYASTVGSAVFTGGAGTVSVGGTLYAKNGGALTLTVTTSSDTQCVALSGAHTGRQTSTSAKSSWTF